MDRRRGFRYSLALISAVLAVAAGAPVMAQDMPASMVKASDAPGVLAVLKQAGYKAKLEPRKGEDSSTSIEIITRDGSTFVTFSDCDEAIPDLCETLVLSTNWNRKTPISDSAIAEANLKFKYVSVFRDEDGDPVMQWAILTDVAGIAPPLVLTALQRYHNVVRDFDEVVFEGDEVNKPADPSAPTA